MHFNVSALCMRNFQVTKILQVEGSLRSGVVKLHMIKMQGQADFEYKYLALDVEGDLMFSFIPPNAYCRKGYPRIYIENTGISKDIKRPSFRFFGVDWR